MELETVAGHIGRRQAEAFRAARLVVDTGLINHGVALARMAVCKTSD